MKKETLLIGPICFCDEVKFVLSFVSSLVVYSARVCAASIIGP